MDGTWRDPWLAEVRRAAEEHTRSTSLRHLAAEIGVGPGTLRRFMEGGSPGGPRTRRRLVGWYAREERHRAPELTVRTADLLLRVLAEDFPAAMRPRVRRELMEALAECYRAVRAPSPAWLAELRETADGAE